MAILGNTGQGVNPNQNGFQITESLLKSIMMKIGIKWANFQDIYPLKMLFHNLATPYYDIRGLFNFTANAFADIVFSSKFKIKVKSGLADMGGSQMIQPGKALDVPAGIQKINDLIEDELFGRNALRENLRRHATTMFVLGNMATTVGRGEQGVEIRYHNGVSSIPFDWDGSDVTRIATIYFKHVDDPNSAEADRVFAIVCIDGLFLRQYQVFDVTGGAINTNIKYGLPDWYMAFDNYMMPEFQETPALEIGHKKSQWWRLPTEDVRHSETPFTNGLLWNINLYQEVLKTYLDAKKELGYKKPILFYNKSFDEPTFAKVHVAQSFDAFNNVAGPDQVWFAENQNRESAEKIGNVNNFPGVWPNSNSFMPFMMLYNSIAADYSPTEGITRGDKGCVFKTLMDKNKLIEMWDPAIRPDFWDAHAKELAQFGKVARLGARWFQIMAENPTTATEQLTGDRDLLDLVSSVCSYFERPLKQMILACCDYWVEEGSISSIDVPTKMNEIEVIWDFVNILDSAAEKARMLSMTNVTLSRHYINRNVFHMTNDEILQNDIEMIGDPLMALQMKQQSDTNSHIAQASFGKLGTSVAPVGADSKSSHPSKANSGSGTAKGKASGSEG